MKALGLSFLTQSLHARAKLKDKSDDKSKALEFKDINFKLAVIDILMYEEKIIKPSIDPFEFAESYSERNINVEKEGYEIIPEILEYFDNLDIQASQVEGIEEIYQDGGNDIYMTISPFWNGEDDRFNIGSAEDASLLPNLKKITLFGGCGALLEEFKSKGVAADWL